MKSLIFSGILAVVFPVASFAAANDVASLLDGYTSTDLNNKCRVELQGNNLKISRSNSETKQMQVRFSNSKALASGILELSDSDYTGSSSVILIKKERSLLVLATLEDSDNGLDQASFCELEKK